MACRQYRAFSETSLPIWCRCYRRNLKKKIEFVKIECIIKVKSATFLPIKAIRAAEGVPSAKSYLLLRLIPWGEGQIFLNENFGFGLMSKIQLRSYSVGHINVTLVCGS